MAVLKAGHRCAQCGADIWRNHNVHHPEAVRTYPDLALIPANHVALCLRCHGQIEAAERNINGSPRPTWLPKPRCTVFMIAGPPAAGKSTYVAEHKQLGDIVIDFDEIAKEMGFDRDVPKIAIGAILAERNRRLAKLARASVSQRAWFILTGASLALRQWWAKVLGIQPSNIVVLAPPKAELERRIKTDPTRRWVVAEQLQAVDQWFIAEASNRPSYVRRGCDEKGFPLDELHPWSRAVGE